MKKIQEVLNNFWMFQLEFFNDLMEFFKPIESFFRKMKNSHIKFLEVESNEKWVDYVKDKIKKNDISYLNLSKFKYFDDENSLKLLIELQNLETLNLSSFIEFKPLHLKNLMNSKIKHLDLSGKNLDFLTHFI